MIVEATFMFVAKDGLTAEELIDALSDVEIHLESVGAIHSKAMGGDGGVSNITVTVR